MIGSLAGAALGVLLVAALAAATTALSLRLLAVRRGWTMALLAGAIGWGTGGLLALGLADWEWGADGLLLHALAIALPTTMLAAVVVDLLARPGSLATGERAGLIVTPRPLGVVRTRIAILRRYRELLRLFRKEGFGLSLRSLRGEEGGDGDPVGVRLRRVLEEAGGVYIKLGQIAATRIDLIPTDIADELTHLQNRVAPEPREAIEAVLERELAGSVDEVFAEFDWEPLAAASIGQTHLARLRSGEAVVVKVQRPGIERVMARDLADQLLRCSLEQVLRAGFFHADPHPGNVFVFRDGTLGLIDFGAVGRLDSIQKAAVIDIMVALAHCDVSLLRDGVERVAELTEVSSIDQLERALARLMADHIRPSGTIQPTVLQDLVATLTRFGVHLPGDLVILSRALVTLDGTLRRLSPEVSLVTAATGMMTSPAAQPILEPEAMVRAELQAALPHLRRLPDRIDRILTLTSRGDLRVRTVLDEDGRRILRTLVNRLLFAAVGTAFLAVSAILLVAADDGPAVATGTGLFEVLGYGGLLAGTVLLLRVAAAVARDGTT